MLPLIHRAVAFYYKILVSWTRPFLFWEMFSWLFIFLYKLDWSQMEYQWNGKLCWVNTMLSLSSSPVLFWHGGRWGIPQVCLSRFFCHFFIWENCQDLFLLKFYFWKNFRLIYYYFFSFNLYNFIIKILADSKTLN